MESELKRILRGELVKAQPMLGKPYMYDRCVNSYVDVMVLETHRALALNLKGYQLKDNEFAFSAVRATHAAKRTGGTPQQYAYHLMQQNPKTALLLESRTGCSKQGFSHLSSMRFNPIYEDLMIEEILNLRVEKNQQLLDDIKKTYTHIVDVDIYSLQAFIHRCRETLAAGGKGKRYDNAVLRNLSAAQQLMRMVHEADERNPHSAYLLERYKTEDCGRIYGEGYSLQRMNKEVRHAALGVCYKYDFKACAFAVMASLATTINPSISTSAVQSYIKKRAEQREKIAKQTGLSVEMVKTVFTALGFGAKLRNTHFSAIRRELGKYAALQHDRNVWLEKEEWNKLGEVEYKRLLDNPLFIRIYDEFQQINATIIQYYKDKECEIGGFIYSNIDPNWKKKGKKTNKRLNPQKLAWIYQACETWAREQFEQLSEQKALLTTHDCIYFKEKLDDELVRYIKGEMMKTFQYLNFECEPISPIADKETTERRRAEREEADDNAIARQLEMQQRDDFWQRQEGITLEMRPNDMCETLLKSQDVKSEYEYEVAHRQQFMRDVGITTYDVGSTADEYVDYEYEYVVDQ